MRYRSTLVPVLPLLLVLMALGSAPALAHAKNWPTYRNDRYGFTIKLPHAAFDTRQESDNGDGVTLALRDGRARLLAYGFIALDGEGPKTVSRAMVEDMEGAQVTYQRVTGKWAVVSGFVEEGGEGKVFYIRIQQSADGNRYSAFQILYPAALRDLFDPLIAPLSKSLSAPR